jgi:hypothetical protein
VSSPIDQVNAITAQALDDLLAAAGRDALAEAQRLFELDVTNSDTRHSRDVISSILHTCGWTWPEVYPYHGTVQYCVLTAGHCWAKAGLRSSMLTTFFASTMRVDAWARYQKWNEHDNPRPPVGPYRLVASLDAHSTRLDLPFTPRAGDIITIGDGDPASGDHCLLVESYDPSNGAFACISGNGAGLGPDGKRRVGIVRSTVRIGGAGYCVRRVIRPSVQDLVG